MKKGLVVSAAVILIGLSMPKGIFAENPEQVLVIQEQVEYEEISMEELPEGISQTLQQKYAEFAVSKAFVGSDSTYKVIITKGDDTSAVFFNADGKFLKTETVKA